MRSFRAMKPAQAGSQDVSEEMQPMFLNWWSKWITWTPRVSRRRTRRHAWRKSFALLLEQLEARRLFNATQPAAARLLDSYGQVPLDFERNAGQTDPQVQYL